MKTHLILIAALATAVVSVEAAAQPAASCTLQSTSRLDGLLNPPKGSDERFFTAGSGPPNIMMLLDTSCSMSWWPLAWSNSNSNSWDDDSSGVSPGCRQANIDALGYDKTVTYARMWINLTTESPWFISNSYYQFNGNGGGTQVSFNMGNNPMNFTVPPTGTTISLTDAAACNAVTGGDAAALADCQSCLLNKGYFQYRDDRRVARGNFLNFYGPRGQGALNSITNAMRSATKARFGVVAFSAGAGAPGTVQWPGNNVNLFAPMGPSCANSLLPAQISANSNSIITKLSTGIQFNTSTPLDQYLYGALHYFRGDPGGASDPFPGFFPLGFPTTAGFNDSTAPSNPAVCFDCGFSAMILLTDGQPNQSGFELPSEIRNLPTPCPSCGGAAAGINNDTQGGNSHIFRTADWGWNHDLRPELANQQRIATYTVAYALNDANTLALLSATAVAGGGNFYLATNSSQLSTALSAIINDVTNRNISFSSSSISSFQTGSTSSAILPRMAPGKNNQPWVGALWRFNQFNEFVENFDKNNDGDINDIFVVDSTGYVIGTDYSSIPIPGDIVVEDSNGAFVKATATPIPLATATVAVPFYEARVRLFSGTNNPAAPAMAYSASTRNILTVLDDSADGRLTAADAMAPFTVGNAANLAPYLGILGTSFCPQLVAAGSASCIGGAQDGQSCTIAADCPGGVCPPGVSDDGEMFKKFGMTIAQMGTLYSLPVSTQAELDTLCVTSLIEFVRGRDLGDENADTFRDEMRPSVLGDIFHSSPVVVDPPVDRFICDLVVNYQCVTTLFNQQLNGTPATPLDSRPLARCGVAAAPVDAYDEYLHVNRRRDKVILVGANDGMLHAFRESYATETQASGLCTVKYEPSNGAELWAFIPPDQLSRLRELVLGHTYFVDGDVMVRDIWADGSGTIVPVADGRKQADEYHTVAVVAEGRGGVHYFALDIRANPTLGGTAGGGGVIDPKFLWMFPQPDSDEAALAGKALLSITPKAPPIGPVLLKDTTAKGIASRYGGTEERWVTMLAGGWSPGGEKGRGVFMLDVWNGGPAVIDGVATGRTDNLLWSLSYDELALGKKHGPKKAFHYGVAAPIAMADFGANDAALGYHADGFFDTAVWGDLAGQIWVARMHQPGEISGGGKTIDNWAAARAFQMDRYGLAGGNAKSVRNRQPFYYLPALVIQPDNGALRAMMGTGDRNSLLDSQSGGCRFDNLLACAKYGCDVEVKYEIERLGFKVNEAKLKWENTQDKEDKLITGGAGYTACGNPGGSPQVKASISKNDVNNCPKQGGGTDSFPDIRKMDVECAQTSAGHFSCNRTDSNTDSLTDLNWPIETARLSPMTYLGNNRFYAMRVYGGLNGNVYDETAASVVVDGPDDFDAKRYTDRTAANPTRGDLVDVTGTTCTATGVCTCGTPPCASSKDGIGWVVDYVAGLSHKTGGGGSVPSGGCLLWNVVYPTTTVTACSTSAARSRFFQAQYITGEPSCAEGLKNIATNTWDRYQDRSVLAPPPEPATAIAINKITGQIKYSGVVLEPGSSQATEVVVSKGIDLLQSISSLPLSRQEHLCRHVHRDYCKDIVQP